MRSCTNIMPVLQTPIPLTDDGLIVSNYVRALITSPLIFRGDAAWTDSRAVACAATSEL